MSANQMNIASYTSRLRTKINEFLRDELKGCGYGELVPSYGAVLSVVYRNGGKVQIKTIYDDLQKQKTTITESINRLVELGYLKKSTCPTDGRCTYVTTTEKADDFYRYFNRISNALKDKIYAGFTPEEQEEFADLLERAVANFE
jgi:DNA-binding MarR family transcriptional regulator